MNASSPAKALRLDVWQEDTGPHTPLPDILRTTTRAGVSEIDPLLDGVTVSKRYLLASPRRGEVSGKSAEVGTAQAELLALETEDGSTLFIRADALAEAVAQVRPEAVENGAVNLARLRDPNAASRGVVDLLWKAVSVLHLPDTDVLLEEAKELARQWARDKLGEAISEPAWSLASCLGAKALMWKIESRLAGRPGLYRWLDTRMSPADYCPPGDARLAAAAAGKPMLLFLHGTASYTVGAFTDLREHKPTWDALSERFPGGIFGYEHRTFSESPVENALALAQALPLGARISLISHSRGGLVGDLLSLGQVGERAIDAWRINAPDVPDAAGLEREANEERQRLRELRDTLATRRIVVERYVRVACPARGTRILSENLDVALSDFLNLLQVGGGALVRATAAALGGPVAAQAAGAGASSCLGVLKRLVLEIARHRIDPRMVPGIAAMRTDSPLAAFLAHPDTRRRDGIEMAVIAGDTEFEGLGISNFGRRIANLFCDWRLFDRNDNDLVVDTESMFAGLGTRPGARYLYDQDASVTHFRYFRNPLTRDALRGWMDKTDALRDGPFQALTAAHKTPWSERDRATKRATTAEPQPVVILLPGIMGTHLKVGGQRVWFDLPQVMAGRVAEIADVAAASVTVDDLFEFYYGDLADHLAASHAVIRFPYDWRKGPDDAAAALKETVDRAVKDHPRQPIRLLAHSMGGLVVRALMNKHAEAWKTVVDSGGRVVMLGTPHHGSHLMVHSLLGKSDTARMLATVDLGHSLQDIVDILARFPGTLSLLPRPGFQDTGGPQCEVADTFYEAATWTKLKNANADRWFGSTVGGVPSPEALKDAKACWTGTLHQDTPISTVDAQRIACVFGQSGKTPCGVRIGTDGRLKLLFTPDGDGSVTWASGQLAGVDMDTRGWYMPVEHADLTAAEEYFPAIQDLLERGSTDKLDRLPRSRGAAAPAFELEAPPPVHPSEAELLRALQGSGARRLKPSRARPVLRVSVRAEDLRYADQPVLCGHYVGDAISGAEAELDRMLGNALTERERLGLYAGPFGTSAIALHPPNDEERARGTQRGAVIVGLGEYTGQLTARQITETVRAGVLRYLLQMRDARLRNPGEPITLYSLLIGSGSTGGITLRDSVGAVTRGVVEANNQFETGSGTDGQRMAVTELCFIELYRDAAITAAEAVLDLPDAMADDLSRLRARIEAARSLTMGEGVRDRLSVAADLGHWARLIVTDAAAREDGCPPPTGKPAETKAAGTSGTQGASSTAGTAAHAPPAASRYYPQQLKYVFLSARARAETTVLQRQPGLIEALISAQMRRADHDPKLGNALFQLTVPLDYKAAAREQQNLMLVLDPYTANLPWELLQDGPDPLAIRIPMVRQLATRSYRTAVRTANANTACIIAAPSTDGFNKRFPPGNVTELPKLDGAVREAEAIRASLREANWSDTDIVSTPPEQPALDVFTALYDRPYRILAIAAHGLFEARGWDGQAYTGVVLSDGLLLSAAEVSQMETVPEVVFLSCCHVGSFGQAGQQEPNRLAYSLAQELIEMGVRCVVAAGWAVDDSAACTFSSKFFDLLTHGTPFGEAVFQARTETYQRHRTTNTWGAYQAWGDPGYRLRLNAADKPDSRRRYVAVDQLLDSVRRQARKVDHPAGTEKAPRSFAQQQAWVARQLALCPPAWAERPDVLQAIGALYAKYGNDGFRDAASYYLRALQGHDPTGQVAVSTIEQLANLEARRGERLLDGKAPADAAQIDEAMRLIDSAITRLEHLEKLVSVPGGGPVAPHPERAALLGSARKRRATALLRQNKAWTEVQAELAFAAQAYASGVQGDRAACPYNTLNALVLAWLADDQAAAGDAQLAQRCGDAARERFAKTKDLWDAMMSADAQVTAWLLSATPSKAPDFTSLYRDAAQGLPLSPRQWDSVITQWKLVAEFLRARGRPKTADDAGDALRAQVLGGISPGGAAASDARAGGSQPSKAKARTRKSKNPDGGGPPPDGT